MGYFIPGTWYILRLGVLVSSLATVKRSGGRPSVGTYMYRGVLFQVALASVQGVRVSISLTEGTDNNQQLAISLRTYLPVKKTIPHGDKKKLIVPLFSFHPLPHPPPPTSRNRLEGRAVDVRFQLVQLCGALARCLRSRAPAVSSARRSSPVIIIRNIRPRA